MARTVTERPLIRCAIYTRQSVARETDLTSCDVQRSLCEAFVGSMQYEGWTCSTDRFDEVGVSGGTLDRPALRRLVKAIATGQVDHVVVHRFDRLTRSLRDWVVLRELFDGAGVELTAVASGHAGQGSVLTGFINNVLASFGQFERDLIGERLHESRAARRARGLRSSGRVPFGYLLRHVLLCGKCSGPITTSASQAVTIENADEVPRYYRCRGSAQGPACRPTVQVAAREVEQEVLRQLQAPGSIRDLSPNARRFLENVATLWPSLPRGELNYWVRTLVWAATWNPDTRKADIVFDEIGLENAIAENPELLKPLPDKVLRKLRGRKGARSTGSTRK
jgi:DNA invertase Pin-like site-specific DNA recombinase